MTNTTTDQLKNERGLLLGIVLIILQMSLIMLAFYNSVDIIHLTSLGEMFFSLHIVLGGVVVILSNYYAHTSFYFRYIQKFINIASFGKKLHKSDCLLMGYLMVFSGIIKIVVFDL